MLQVAPAGGTADEAQEHVRDDDEEVRGERVVLAESMTTSDPAAGNTVQGDSRFATREDRGDPVSPPIIKTSRREDPIQAAPFHRVECFCKIQFQNKRGTVALMTALHKFSGINKVF